MDTEQIQPHKEDKNGKNDQNSKENKSVKNSKSDKGVKNDKNDKSGRSNESGKAGKEVKSSKPSKSNKTAHVLSLLTDSREKEPDTSREISSAPLSKIPTSPIGLVDDETVANEIRSALEDALEEELLAETNSDASPFEIPAPEPSLREEPAGVEPTQAEQAQAGANLGEPSQNGPGNNPTQDEPARCVQTQSEQAQDASGQGEASQDVQALSDQPDVSAASAAPVEGGVPGAASEKSLMPPSVVSPGPLAHISYVNVMQSLVEEKVDKYIRLFGLCTCPRCKIDVIALALTNLPAKYVVVRQNEAIPMLTVYESRYNAMVISQVMWACKKVMDNPRHSLEASSDASGSADAAQ